MALAATAGLIATRLKRPPPRPPAPSPTARVKTQPEAVAALGRLEPQGNIRTLAAPSSDSGLAPRLSQLLVEEGQSVRQGQVLARFDSGPGQRAEENVLRTRIANLSRRVEIAGRDLLRYRRLMAAGAFARAALDLREQAYLELQGELQEARADLVRVEADRINTELRAPIDGTVLRIQARVGERPGEAGILELANSDRMEAVLEIYESDINRIRLGQRVRVSSENGGFSGTLEGVVTRISPQVRQREVLSTDPTRDADARIVEVRASLDPRDALRVRSLTGLKIIGRLEP
jgi:HlyD family secretion protein